MPARRPLTLPDYMAAGVVDIDMHPLTDRGVRHAVYDFDQTLIAPGDRELRTEIVEHLQPDAPARLALQSLSIATHTVRNVRRLAGPLQPDAIFRPFGQDGRLITKCDERFFERILTVLDAEPETVAVIGDQYLVDVVAAKRVGMVTVKVNPLGPDYRFDRRRRDRDDQALALARRTAQS